MADTHIDLCLICGIACIDIGNLTPFCPKGCQFPKQKREELLRGKAAHLMDCRKEKEAKRILDLLQETIIEKAKAAGA